MTQSEFKSAARRHQINFKINDSEINIPRQILCPQTKQEW